MAVRMTISSCSQPSRVTVQRPFRRLQFRPLFASCSCSCGIRTEHLTTVPVILPRGGEEIGLNEAAVYNFCSLHRSPWCCVGRLLESLREDAGKRRAEISVGLQAWLALGVRIRPHPGRSLPDSSKVSKTRTRSCERGAMAASVSLRAQDGNTLWRVVMLRAELG